MKTIFTACARVALLFAAVACTTGCSRYYYRPTSINAPLLAAKGEVHASLGNNKDGDGVKSSDVQLAYSPIKHLGIVACYNGFSYTDGNYSYAAGQVDAKAHIAEMGAGYYYVMGDKVKLLADVYAGYGAGKMSSDVTMNIHRPYLQPGISLRGKWVEVAWNYRLSAVGFRNFDDNGRGDQYLIDHSLIYNGRRIDNGSYFFGDQCLTLRGGYRFIMLEAQWVGSNALSQVPWKYNSGLFTLGLSLKFEELNKMLNHAGEQKEKVK